MSPLFFLNKRKAKRELDVFVDNKRLVFQQAPKLSQLCCIAYC